MIDINTSAADFLHPLSSFGGSGNFLPHVSHT